MTREAWYGQVQAMLDGYDDAPREALRLLADLLARNMLSANGCRFLAARLREIADGKDPKEALGLKKKTVGARKKPNNDMARLLAVEHQRARKRAQAKPQKATTAKAGKKTSTDANAATRARKTLRKLGVPIESVQRIFDEHERAREHTNGPIEQRVSRRRR